MTDKQGRVLHWKCQSTWPESWPIGGSLDDCDLDRLELRLRQEFAAIRAFHACRTTNVNSYYSNGLRIPSEATLREHAVTTLSALIKPALPVEEIVAAAKPPDELPVERLYVGLDDRFALRYCGHYLVYGSEYVIAVAAELSRTHGRDYRQVLKTVGRPTMFICDVPLSSLPSPMLRDLAAILAESDRDSGDSFELDFTLTLRDPLPPDCIVGHYHPKVIRDPFLGYSDYVAPIRTSDDT